MSADGEGVRRALSGVRDQLADDGKVVWWHDHWDFRALEKLAPAG